MLDQALLAVGLLDLAAAEILDDLFVKFLVLALGPLVGERPGERLDLGRVADALDRAFATDLCVDTTGVTVAEVVDRVRARTGWPNLAAPVESPGTADNPRVIEITGTEQITWVESTSGDVLSSISVVPPGSAARNRPSGFRTCAIWSSAPGRSLTVSSVPTATHRS